MCSQASAVPRYSLLVSQIPLEGEITTQYGVSWSWQGKSGALPGLTEEKALAESFLARLNAFAPEPVHLLDLAEDFLAAQYGLPD